MFSVPFFSEHDVEHIAYGSWLWDIEHGLTTASWEACKSLYRDRAEFVVECLNKRMCTA